MINDPSIQKYLSRLSQKTAANRYPILKVFFNHVGIAPSEAVAWQRQHPGDYELLDKAFDWLDSDVHLGYHSKRNRYYAIRGFFRKNRAAMPVDDTPRFHTEKQRVDGHLTVDELKQILHSCNLMYRCIFLMMFQGGLGCEALEYVNVTQASDVRRRVLENQPFIQLQLPGRKQNRNLKGYYTFIGYDSIETLRQYFHSRSYRKDTVLFRSERGLPVSHVCIHAYFKEHVIRTGLVKRYTPRCLDCGGETVKQRKVIRKQVKLRYSCVTCGGSRDCSDYKKVFNHNVRGGVRYGKNPHELRDLFLTEWHRSGADLDAANFMMGHTIDPLGYDKIMRDEDYARAQYRKAAPYLNILSENPRVIDKLEVNQQLETQQQQIREMQDKINVLSRSLYMLAKE